MTNKKAGKDGAACHEKKREEKPKEKELLRLANFAREPDHQTDSRFFQLLPPELRDMVYRQLFLSRRVAYGQKNPQYEKGMNGCWITQPNPRPSLLLLLEPAQNALAMLRTCQRAKSDIGNSWLGQVLCSFDEIRTILDQLATPNAKALPHVFNIDNVHSDVNLWDLRPLPGALGPFLGLLQLDRLTALTGDVIIGHTNPENITPPVVEGITWDGLYCLEAVSDYDRFGTEGTIFWRVDLGKGGKRFYQVYKAILPGL
ncbi:hypothetical protein GGR56DRAFT_631535 [Xylariaceae sp. FL0804]|nr:hypothetical protein GGR56DRAFT_631535 [Xylariaceae sp. FL0804]